MSDYVKLQAERAKEIYPELSEEELRELNEIAEEIMELQREITGSIKANGLDEICRVCDGECCTREYERNIFDEYYFIMALVGFSDEVRMEIMETAECINFSPRCMYLGEDGCRIAEDSRPFKCKIWFCDSRYSMIKIQIEFHDRLLELYEDFKRVVDKHSSLHNISCAN